MPVPDEDLEANYTYVEGDGLLIGPLLDGAIAEEEDLAIVALSLHRQGLFRVEATRETARDHITARALSYDLVAHQGSSIHWSLELFSSDGDGSGRTPAETSPAALQLWESCLENVTHPSLVARYRDLLFSAKHHRGPVAAREVIHAYLGTDSSGQFWTHGLARAISIARPLRLHEEEAAIRSVLLSLAENHVADGSALGLVLDALELLSEPATEKPLAPEEDDRIRAVFSSAWEVIKNNLPLVDALAAANRRFAKSPEEKRVAGERHVKTYLCEEDTSPNLRRLSELSKAAQLAKHYELPALKDQAIAALQALARKPLEGHKLRTPFRVPSWLVAAQLHPYRRSRDWRQGLEEWLHTGAPTGSWADAQRRDKDATGLLSFVTNITLGSHGLPERTRSTPEAQAMAALHKREQRLALFQGIVLAEALALIGKKSTNLSEDALMSFLHSETLDKPLTQAFSHALWLFLRGHTSDAGVLAVPIVEAAARGALLILNEPLYRMEAGASPGRFPALDVYIEALSERGLDEDWVRSLRIVMTDQGLNLRNMTAHGFKLAFSPAESALVLRLAGMLLLMNGSHSTEESDAWADRQFRSPLLRRSRRWRFLLFR